MECPGRLCTLEEPNLFRSSRKDYTWPWTPVWTSILPITLRPRNRPREWIRFSRIYWEPMLCSMEEVGKRVYHTPSSHTPIAIKRVWIWCRLRCYMVEGTKPHCLGMRLENRRFLDPTYCKKSRDKFVWWERTCRLHNQDRRVTPTIGEENWVLKLEIMCTSRCHLWEVYDIFKVRGKVAPRFIGPIKITKEREEELKTKSPNNFSGPSESRGRDSF
jgi:hypothetical protein